MRRIALLSLLLLAPLGCDDKKGAPAAPSAPSANPAAPSVPSAPNVPANPAVPANPNDPAAQMQKALGGMFGAQNNPNAKAVSWRDLAPLLGDDLAGWKADGDVKGESTQMGAFSVSEARRSYKKGDSSATVKIVDTSMNTMLAAAFNMARMANVDASDHYQKGIDIAGAPGVEEWHSGGKNAKVSVLVGGRFIVESNTSGVPDAKPLVELVGKLDFGKLASLGK
ncbi:MAG TPA: hypothetical protein VFF06_17600 [Polyangia bacterium]|nr:hypothetical protein [Polyangia bacterium]